MGAARDAVVLARDGVATLVSVQATDDNEQPSNEQINAAWRQIVAVMQLADTDFDETELAAEGRSQLISIDSEAPLTFRFAEVAYGLAESGHVLEGKLESSGIRFRIFSPEGDQLASFLDPLGDPELN
jgi:hypothetical protein